MSGTLRLRREGVGIELRRGRFEIWIDGANAGSIAYGETVDVPVEPGRHILRMRAGRYSSRDQPFEVADGEVVDFRCHGAMVWPRYVASILSPGLGIALRKE